MGQDCGDLWFSALGFGGVGVERVLGLRVERL